jgi:hypothetical protein
MTVVGFSANLVSNVARSRLGLAGGGASPGGDPFFKADVPEIRTHASDRGRAQAAADLDASRALLPGPSSLVVLGRAGTRTACGATGHLSRRMRLGPESASGHEQPVETSLSSSALGSTPVARSLNVRSEPYSGRAERCG